MVHELLNNLEHLVICRISREPMNLDVAIILSNNRK